MLVMALDGTLLPFMRGLLGTISQNKNKNDYFISMYLGQIVLKSI